MITTMLANSYILHTHVHMIHTAELFGVLLLSKVTEQLCLNAFSTP